MEDEGPKPGDRWVHALLGWNHMFGLSDMCNHLNNFHLLRQPGKFENRLVDCPVTYPHVMHAC